MALAQYTDKFWYPDGTLAINVPVRVFPLMNNVLAPLFADQAGTIPITNPVLTGPTGQIAFWAEEGEYWLRTNEDGLSDSFRVSVGVSQEQAHLSTGTVYGGEINPSATPAAIDIAPLTGYIVTHSDTSPAAPAIVKVVSPARTEPLTGASLTRILTWWLMNSSGVVFQQADQPTPEQRRANLVIGLTAFDGVSTIVFDQTLPVFLQQPANQFSDLMESLGPFSVSGNRIIPNAGTLSFDKTEGRIFARAFNYVPDETNPHISILPAQAPVSFMYNTQIAFSEGPLTTLLDPGNYDVGGVVTPVPSPTDVTIQRVWGYPLNELTQQVRVQYGQSLFPDLVTAADAIRNVYFNVNPEAEPFAALIAHIVIRANATDLNDPTQAMVLKAGKFDAP